MKSLNVSIEELVNSIDCGLILLDQNKHIILWNNWIAQRSGIAINDALGKSISVGFNEPLNKQFVSALDNAFTFGTSLTLSNMMHQQILPLFNSSQINPTIDQTISVKMLSGWTVEPLCMIQIMDVGSSINNEKNPIEQSENNTKLELDPLTNLYSRRFFDEYYRIELGRLQRLKQPFFLMLLDVDCFKDYNENYGEEAGDVALIRVAYSMKKILRRTSDVIARFGGEEFIFILRDTNAHEAQITAEKLRKIVSNLAIEHDYSEVDDHITVSIGVVGCDPQTSSNVNQLVEQVEVALHKAKQAGRNQVYYLEA